MQRLWRLGSAGGALIALALFGSATPLIAQVPIPASKTSVKAGSSVEPGGTVGDAPAKPRAAGKAIAVAKSKPERKKLAAAAKKPSSKLAAIRRPLTAKITAAKKTETTKVASAPPQSALRPSYTVTTTVGNVTYRTTEILPIPASGKTVAPPPTAAAATEPSKPPTSTAAVTPPSGAEHKPSLSLAAVAASSLARAAATEPGGTGAQVAAVTSSPAAEQRPTPRLASLATASLAGPPATPTPSEAPAPVATPTTPATGFVSSFLAAAFSIARDPNLNPPQRRSALAKLFADSMDMSRIAGITAGDGLTTESADFQRRFRSILVSYLVETYYPQIELAADPTVKVDTAAASPLPDGTVVAWTTFNKSDWVSQSVHWQLIPVGNGYKIADIYTGGVSLVQMERDTFHSVMRDGGLPELMAKLDARTKALASAAKE